MADTTEISSKDIFLQYCQAKKDKANEFINDYILYCLNLKNEMDSTSYQDVLKFIFDFMIGCDELLKFFCDFIVLPQENFTKENFSNKINKELNINNDELTTYFYGILLSNLDKIYMLRNKNKSQFDDDEIKNYKVNIQMDLGHSNISNLDNEFKVLLQIKKNNHSQNENDIFQIDEKDLDSLISQLKDIYVQVKC